MRARITCPLQAGATMLGLGLFLATSVPTSAQQRTTGTDIEAVRAAVHAHWDAINRGDGEAVQAQHLPGGTGFLTEWGPRLGLDTDGLEPFLLSVEGSVPDWHPRDVEVQAFGDVAVASFYLDGSLRRADGTVDAGPRRVTEVWVRTADGWKEAHHHDDPVPAADARAEVERASDAWWDALLRSDLDASMRFWTDDAVALPPGEEAMVGLAALRDGINRQFQAIRLEDLEMTSRQIEVMGGTAHEWATYTVSIVPTSGGPGERVEGRYSVTWHRQPDGAWKAARDLWNFGGAPAASGPAAAAPDAERARIVSEVEGRAQQWLEVANRLDVSSLRSLVSRDLVFVDFSNRYEGADAYVAGARELISRFRSWTSAWDRTRVEVLAPDAAVLEGRFTLEREQLDGRRQESAPYLYMTAVFRLVDGQWLMGRGHLSGSVRAVEGTGGTGPL